MLLAICFEVLLIDHNYYSFSFKALIFGKPWGKGFPLFNPHPPFDFSFTYLIQVGISDLCLSFLNWS